MSANSNTVMIIQPIKLSSFTKLMKSFPNFESTLWKKHFYYFLKMFGNPGDKLYRLL
jgi:hypothetical protein